MGLCRFVVRVARSPSALSMFPFPSNLWFAVEPFKFGCLDLICTGSASQNVLLGPLFFVLFVQFRVLLSSSFSRRSIPSTDSHWGSFFWIFPPQASFGRNCSGP